MKTASLATGSVLLALALGACAPVVRSHGYTPVPEALGRIEPGLDTRASVQSKIGRPSASGVFDETGWYYVSTRIEHFAFYEPEVIDRRVVAITFNAEDVVEDKAIFGLEDGRVIDLETRTTPTYGRQLTIVEQIFSNIGTVAGSDFFDN